MTEIANEPDASLQVSNRLVLYDIVGTNSGGQEGSHEVRPRTMSEIKTSLRGVADCPTAGPDKLTRERWVGNQKEFVRTPPKWGTPWTTLCRMNTISKNGATTG